MKERLTERIDNYIKLNTNSPYADKMAIERLAEYEDKIEDGTLVELPCAVGDIAYRIWNKERVIPVRVIRITFAGDTIFETTFGDFSVNDFGENIFITKAEAEKKLKELRGEE